MGCRRTTRSVASLVLVAALLVSLLTPHLPIARARHVVLIKPNKGLNNNRGDMDLAKEPAPASTDDMAAKKGFSGRKLGARHEEEAEATGVTTTSAGSRPRTLEMRAAAERGDAATEMYDMLRRDYAWKASRRRPINNGAKPLQEKQP